MSALPQDIIDAIENLVEEKFNELIAANKLDVTAEATSLEQFQEEMMISHDGDEPITQGFFRVFLDWLAKYYTYNLSLDAEAALEECRYITPVDFEDPPDVGKIIAAFANLTLTGAGVEPEIPDPASTTPDDAGFNPALHIMEGGFALNKTDNKWYYRCNDTIYELKEALSLGVADISDFESALTTILADYVEKETGKGLSANDLTSVLKAAYDGVVSAYAAHAGTADIHTPPDGTTIEISSSKLAVISSAILALFSGTAPIVRTSGAFSLSINTDQFEIVDNKLQIKAGVLGGGDPVLLTFNEGTGELTIGSSGDTTVDLSSLAGGEGSVDLSNYVKKTGESSQTIEGDLKVTGESSAFE